MNISKNMEILVQGDLVFLFYLDNFKILYRSFKDSYLKKNRINFFSSSYFPYLNINNC